mgnify:CR=1 FL=1
MDDDDLLDDDLLVEAWRRGEGRADGVLSWGAEPLFRIQVYPTDPTSLEYNNLSTAGVCRSKIEDEFRAAINPTARQSQWV